MSNGIKICFFLQRRFAYIGHDLAVNLKNRHGVEKFCGYVTHRPGYRFLKSQKEIEYTTLLLDEDLHRQAKTEKLDLEYIKYLEKEYGMPNLWPYLEVDRVIRFNQMVREYPMDTPIYTHEEMMVQLQVRAKAVIAMLEQEKPDYIICSVLSNLSALLMFNIAKKKGIKFLTIAPTRVQTGFSVSDSYTNFTEVDKKFDELMASGKKVENYEAAKEVLYKFKNNPRPHDTITKFYRERGKRLKQFDFILPTKLLVYFKWLLVKLKYYFQEEDKNDFTYIKITDKIKDQIIRKLRAIRGVSDLYDPVDFEHDDFAFFPLHMEPEVAIDLYGYWHKNQLEVVRQVARSLPLHFKLYVKDHPRMIGYRTRAYYKELKKIPNVKLIDPLVSSLDITPKAKLVTTITGSAGWEAVQMGIPVITFGGVFFNKLSMVKHCDNYEKLPYLVREQLENFDPKEDEVINYIGLVLQDSILLDLLRLWHREPDKTKKRMELIPLADLIAKHF